MVTLTTWCIGAGVTTKSERQSNSLSPANGDKPLVGGGDRTIGYTRQQQRLRGIDISAGNSHPVTWLLAAGEHTALPHLQHINQEMDHGTTAQAHGRMTAAYAAVV